MSAGDRRDSHTDARDAGFTLIELLVTTVLLSAVILVGGGLFISVLTTQRTVSAVTTSATDAQLAASTIESRIRNASEFRLSAAGPDQLLVARSANAGSTLTWSCHAWYYSPANGGSLRTTTTPAGTRIAAPNAAQLATWTLLAQGITPRSGTGIFSASGKQLTISFNATAQNNQPVAIQTTTAILTGVTETLTCY